jgi:hypothetical protein
MSDTSITKNNPFRTTNVGDRNSSAKITSNTPQTSMATTPMPNDNDGNSSNDTNLGSAPILNKVFERLNVIEEESQDHQHLQCNDMTQEVESLLQFMDQYKTFSPLLNSSTIKTGGHRHHHPQYHPQYHDDHYEQQSPMNKHVIQSDTCDDVISTGENKIESSFAHQSTVVSSSSSSSSSSTKSRHGLDLENENDDTGHINHIELLPSPTTIPPDQDNHPPTQVPSPTPSIAMEREKLRAWVIQVRQAVYEWVQEYRQYIMTVHQQQEQERQYNPPPRTQDDNDPSVPQRPYHDDSDPQIIIQRYEQTNVSLNEVIQDQRRRIHELEMNVGNCGKSSEGHRNDELLRKTHVATSSSTQQSQGMNITSTVATLDSNCHDISKLRQNDTQVPFLSNMTRHHTTREKEEHGKAEPYLKKAVTTAQTATTAMIMKTQNCKRIVYSNGTVHEIYYDDKSDIKSINGANDTLPPKQRKQQRNRLYDIIRYYNGDIKMTTSTASNCQRNVDADVEELVETYYYYSKSGIIQIARNQNPSTRDRSSPSIPTATNVKGKCRTHRSDRPSTVTMEYHYPNGQIEYHVGNERVVQFPDGSVFSKKHLK